MYYHLLRRYHWLTSHPLSHITGYLNDPFQLTEDPVEIGVGTLEAQRQSELLFVSVLWVEKPATFRNFCLYNFPHVFVFP